jgi:hypothetical protein
MSRTDDLNAWAEDYANDTEQLNFNWQVDKFLSAVRKGGIRR